MTAKAIARRLLALLSSERYTGTITIDREFEPCPRCDGNGYCSCECHHFEHEPVSWSWYGKAVLASECGVCAIPEHDARLAAARKRLGSRGAWMPERP